MSSSWVFLAVSLVGAAFTVSGLLRVRRLGYLTFPYFMAGWLTSELALHHIMWQLLATGVFVVLGALEAWPGRLGLGITGLSWVGLLWAHLRAAPSGAVVREALREGLGAPLEPPPAARGWRANPFRMRHPEVERIANLPYGKPLPGDKGRRNLLDVYRRPGAERAPTLLQIHGGGWTIGEKEQQALPLINLMAERGWVVIAANYRLSPKATFPDHIIDVKRAIAWIRRHGAEYGCDPDFICITGGSAGGHLVALAALTANDPAFQPGFEDVDTSVAACVPFYGVYDFLDRHGVRTGAAMTPFLEKSILKSSPDERRELWESASPIARIHPDAPPFFVVHGTHDSLVFVEEARLFVHALREKSNSPVAYAELPGAQHAFDSFHSPRSAPVIHAVAAFLEHVRGS
jgi:acetyl esterase/lipase